MLDLIKYDPLFSRFPVRSLARWFDGPSLFHHFHGDEGGYFVPSVDVSESDKEYTITVDVPGFSRDDLKVELEDGVLKLSAEHKEEKEEKKEDYHLRERCYGSFVRRVSLPENTDGEKIEAAAKNGVLTVTIPKTEPSQPKQIQVTVH